MVRMLDLLNLACLAGSALMAGLFFAFSTSVMKALKTLSPACGIAAMQSINVLIINPLFLTAFLGTAVACVLATFLSLLSGRSAQCASAQVRKCASAQVPKCLSARR